MYKYVATVTDGIVSGAGVMHIDDPNFFTKHPECIEINDDQCLLFRSTMYDYSKVIRYNSITGTFKIESRG